MVTESSDIINLMTDITTDESFVAALASRAALAAALALPQRIRGGLRRLHNSLIAARPHTGQMSHALPPLFQIFATLFEKEVVLLVNIILPLSFCDPPPSTPE